MLGRDPIFCSTIFLPQETLCCLICLIYLMSCLIYLIPVWSCCISPAGEVSRCSVGLTMSQIIHIAYRQCCPLWHTSARTLNLLESARNSPSFYAVAASIEIFYYAVLTGFLDMTLLWVLIKPLLRLRQKQLHIFWKKKQFRVCAESHK